MFIARWRKRIHFGFENTPLFQKNFVLHPQVLKDRMTT